MNTLTIDYRDNLWLLSGERIEAEMGFWTLASAVSFATNNMCRPFRLTNAAIVKKHSGR